MFQLWNQYFMKLRATIQYKDYYKKSLQNIIDILNYYAENNQKVAIWGGGLKGNCLLALLGEYTKHIFCVIDMNKNLQGTKTSTGNLITNPEYLIVNNVDIVLVMNKIFYVDVYFKLKRLQYQGKIFDLDMLIEKKVSVEDIIQNNYQFDNDFEDNTIYGYTIREIQESVLEILEEVDRICKKHKLNYFLEAGSALGAKRYQGFIPCDDDIDIALFRNEYEKFIEIMEKELKPGFLLQKMSKGSDYLYPYVQIVKDNTCFVRKEFKNLNMHHGIHIDVAPLDRVPENKKLREKQFNDVRRYTTLIRKKIMPEMYESRNIIKKFIVNYKYYSLKLIPMQYLKYKQSKSFTKYEDKETGFVGDLCTHYKKDISFRETMLIPVKYREFEGKLYPTPNEIDSYLDIMYDDYRTLSPRENGSIKYSLVAVSLEKNYDDLL